LSDVTRILESIQHDDPKAGDELLPLVYGELRKLAAYKMAQSASGHTLQPSARMHEIWPRLFGSENPALENRVHFFAAEVEAMRHLLIHNARRKLAIRHGGGLQRAFSRPPRAKKTSNFDGFSEGNKEEAAHV
jgi:RNA polymerase sigma factor (TIGR02999 family)